MEFHQVTNNYTSSIEVIEKEKRGAERKINPMDIDFQKPRNHEEDPS